MRFSIFCYVLFIMGPLDGLQSSDYELLPDTVVEQESPFSLLNELAFQNQDNRIPVSGLAHNVPISGIGNFFLPELARSECGAWDSCVLRCGDPVKPPYLCSCDYNCKDYGDCCVDQYYYCGTTSPSSPFDQNTTNNSPYGYFQSSILNETDDEQCHKWFGNKFYGILYGSAKTLKSSRRCVLDVPPWCHPNTSVALQWDFAQSLSILLNFGPDGWNNDLLFSSDFYDPDKCPNIWEIWDPFTQICRPIECVDDYILEDGRCIWDGESGKPSSNELIGYTTKRANITFHGNILMKDTVAKFALLSIQKDLISTLSSKIRIDPSRFLNVKIDESPSSVKNPWLKPITPKPPRGEWSGGNDTSEKFKDFHDWILTEEGFPITVNFELDQKDKNSTYDLSIEQILSILHEAVAIRGVLQTNYLVPMKINSIERSVQKEEVKFFEKWCRGGDLLSYWNEEFQVLFVMKNKTQEEGPGLKLTMAVKIQETNETYEEGTYIANLLYQSTDMNAEAANVSGVVIVCENRPKIEDPSCVRLALNETEYTIEPDGTLVFEHEISGVSSVYNRSEYEFKPNGDAVVCINYLEAKTGSLLLRELTLLEKMASYISMILLVLSLLGLLLTIVTYGLFSELRTLPGWCLIHLCLAEFSFFLLFTIGGQQASAQYQVFCTTISVLIHLSALLFFAWSSVISFDLFATFTKFQPVTRSKEKYLLRYSSFAYGLPISIVFTTVMVEFHSDIEINYGKNVCWIGNSMAALYVFAIPIATSIVCNIIFFTLTIIGIKRVSKMATRSNLGQKDRARFTLYLRMSSVQCFAWIFGYLAVFTHFDEILSRIFELMFIILSSLQGLYIFAAFVANKRVKQLYSEKFFSKNPKTRGFGFSVRSTILRPGSSLRSDDNNNNDRGAINENVKPVSALTEKINSTVSDVKIPKRNSAQLAGRTVSNETCVSYLED